MRYLHVSARSPEGACRPGSHHVTGGTTHQGLTNCSGRRDSTSRKGGRSEERHLYLRISRSPPEVARGGLLRLHCHGLNQRKQAAMKMPRISLRS